MATGTGAAEDDNPGGRLLPPGAFRCNQGALQIMGDPAGNPGPYPRRRPGNPVPVARVPRSGQANAQPCRCHSRPGQFPEPAHQLRIRQQAEIGGAGLEPQEQVTPAGHQKGGGARGAAFDAEKQFAVQIRHCGEYFRVQAIAKRFVAAGLRDQRFLQLLCVRRCPWRRIRRHTPGAAMTDPNQFAEFMRAYQNMVFSTAVRLLGNEAEAEDISQEVFLKAYERFGELAGSPTVGGWLKTVTRNLCLNHLTRYRARWRFFSEMFSGEDGEEDRPFEIPAPETSSQQANEADQRRLLDLALQKLPAAQRVPLVLYHFDGLGYEEIASRLRISLAKVKTDIFRGREALRKKLRLSVGDEDEWADYSPNPPPPAERNRPEPKNNPIRYTQAILA